ncbi:MAG: homocitrate synthase [Ferroplasma sp.]|uniref:homocitrate synthase n=1 Tax=Ferroplasma sp. TaxID=2591003 RepID=UPI00281689A4|nr:homocitrate synthase [Ferroplasma sp.]WMT51524.1 MAG: homocitrate synthase [Ferroplasma sp.]
MAIKAGILDSTLREGEQTPGVLFNRRQRVEIARMLSDAKVAMIEAGHPLVSEDIYSAIKEIMDLKASGIIKSEIIAHSRAVASDVDSAASLNVDRIAIFYGVSDMHLRYKTHKSKTEAMDIIYDSISYAASTGIPVRFTAEDASRTDINFLRNIIKTAVEAGADRVSIADTLGVLTPEKTRFIFNNISDINGVEYDFHGHNDMGMAPANGLAALESGASIVHTTVNGLGERVGIIPTQVMAVLMKYHMNIDAANLLMMKTISRKVEEYSGIKLPPNYAITGDYAFTHKSGVHVDGIISNASTYEFMDPAMLGMQRSFTIDKYSGKHALREKLRAMGINLNDSGLSKILAQIKNNNMVYSDEDLKSIISSLNTQ